MCSLGPVLDLSAGGMRCLSKRRVSGEQAVVIHTHEGEVEVRAKVAWTKRRGIRRHEIGLEFIDVDSETSRQLAMISTRHGWLPQRAA